MEEGLQESHFPIKVLIAGSETKVFNRPEDIPSGVVFKLIETRVSEKSNAPSKMNVKRIE